jgi:phage terminase large subunit-like protein
MYWTHELRAPWQSEAWRAQMRDQLRPNGYLRLIENRWVSGEEAFIAAEEWDGCVVGELRPLVAEPARSVWVGVDASVKRDSTAVVALTWEVGKVRLVWHAVFQPSPEEPLDFENTIEATVLDLQRRFHLRAVRYDPFQMASTAQRLAARGVPMQEYPQSVGNLTEMGANLFELIRGRNLALYPDAGMRKAALHAVAIETPRGWRIGKEKTAYKIDVIVALAMAAHAAAREGEARPITDADWIRPAPAQAEAAWSSFLDRQERSPAPWDFRRR